MKKTYLIESSTNEWYTPRIYLDAVRAVLGTIDFDPFSSDEAQRIVKATQYMTAADDATISPWPNVGTIFANPPYQRRLIDVCVKRIIEAAATAEVITLVNAATDSDWCQDLIASCDMMCITHHRIQFIDGSTKSRKRGNSRGQIFFYHGTRIGTFRAHFQQFGAVLKTR